ncbi:MAG: HAD family phosphatase [Verrucomicrobia bacterium]|nr:HAD family phosphatase [Verrucomicrobiota bacterium]
MKDWVAIFDWDGVIVDSSAHHERSWERLAAEEGLPLPADHFRRGFGMKNEEIIPDLLEWTRDPAEVRRLSLRKETIFRDLVRASGIRPLPGVEAWLRRLDAAGIPRIVASSTHRENIETLLAILGLGGFAGIVAADDVRRGKPDPEVFLLAARRLGADPARGVVFEDTPVGIEAARAGGMRVVAVTTTHPASRLARAHRTVARLDELTPDEVGRIAPAAFA